MTEIFTLVQKFIEALVIVTLQLRSLKMTSPETIKSEFVTQSESSGSEFQSVDQSNKCESFIISNIFHTFTDSEIDSITF